MRCSMDTLIAYSSCVGDPEVVQFLSDELNDFSPYRVPLNGPELFAACAPGSAITDASASVIRSTDGDPNRP